MPTFNLKRFCRADGLACVQPANLIQFMAPFERYFASRGLRLPLPPASPPVNLPRLMDVLMSPGPDTPQYLIDALYYTHAMSTPEGMDLLLKEIDTEGCESTWLGEFNPADIAVKAWLHDPEMLQRKHAELHMRDFRTFLYFRTCHCPPFPPFHPPEQEQIRDLETRLGDAFFRKNRGASARVFMYPQKDGTVWFLIRHGDPFRRESALSNGEPAGVAFRPLRFDVAVYDHVNGELRVHAKSRWEFVLYRQEFGRCLFAHMEYFSDHAKYTLEPLRADGAASLRCVEIRGIKYVQLKELHLQWGGAQKEVQIHKALDVFEALKLRHEPMPVKPQLISASFAVRFADSSQPRTVIISPPWSAQFTRDEDATLVEQWLQLRGFVPELRAETTHDQKSELLLEIA